VHEARMLCNAEYQLRRVQRKRVFFVQCGIKKSAENMSVFVQYGITKSAENKSV
jgi:hypothetical protein